jgi:hypothetical protein
VFPTLELSKQTSVVAQYLRFVGAGVADASRGAPLGDAFERLLGPSKADVSTVVTPVDGAWHRDVALLMQNHRLVLRIPVDALRDADGGAAACSISTRDGSH